MNRIALNIAVGSAALATVAVMTGAWVKSAGARFEAAAAAKAGTEAAAVASATDEKYCSPALKTILRRVLTSCGLAKPGEGGAVSTARGCQPVEAKTVAAMSANDFNALFLPMAQRAAIIQFDKDRADLDAAGQALLEKTFADQRGASYFFVVSRASPEGSVEHNRVLSEKRANTVLDHLRAKFLDPDLEKEVGLLWLGEEFAQLDKTFCTWTRSREGECDARALNRSAFIAWIDCHL